MLYKEFLKLLYEEDEDCEEKLEKNKLSCFEDSEFLNEVHKHTVRLWQMLLFWKKRRQMCYETPLLELDLQVIFRSINKVTTYLDVKLPTNEFVHNMSQPVTKAAHIQVKETSVIVEFAATLHKDSLQRRHWVQIFSLIKAAHLKNSLTFTIIDLKEYQIQNYSGDIKQIIDHAFTESRYESVFNSIQNEWELVDIKVQPFKDSNKDYVISNTQTMSDAIEDNIGTLESIVASNYSSHIHGKIKEVIVMLRQMLEHLDRWEAAQKFWITLDPIYNSGLFDGLYGDQLTSFLDSRSAFRRIMWSAFRNPKAVYNLMIKERVQVFKRLIHFYEILQTKAHEYLEEKRLQFTRFFFLNDS